MCSLTRAVPQWVWDAVECWIVVNMCPWTIITHGLKQVQVLTLLTASTVWLYISNSVWTCDIKAAHLTTELHCWVLVASHVWYETVSYTWISPQVCFICQNRCTVVVNCYVSCGMCGFKKEYILYQTQSEDVYKSCCEAEIPGWKCALYTKADSLFKT